MALVDQAKEVFSGVGLSSIGSIITWFLVVLVVILLISGVAIFIVYRKRFDKVIIAFETTGTGIKSTRYKATEIPIGGLGANCFYIPSIKKHLKKGRLQTGNNVWWYHIGPDGEWRNFGLENIDSVLGRANVKLVDEDMRFSNAELAEYLKNQYGKKTFWEQYGTVIVSIIFIVIVGILFWFIAKQLVTAIQSVPTLLEGVNKVLDRTDQIIGKLDSLKGSGTLVTTP